MDRDHWPTRGWTISTPEAQGVSSAALERLDPVIRAEYGNTLGIAVVRHGRLIYERYYGRAPGDCAHVFSAAKSVLSALVGIALEQGCLSSLDQKVLDFFPDYVPTIPDPVREQVTLRHLLTMTAPYRYEPWQEPLAQMGDAPDWVQYSLDLMGGGRPLGQFQYSTAGTQLLSAILSRATGQCARAFANQHLFRPLGMTVLPEPSMEDFQVEDLMTTRAPTWIPDPQGVTIGGFGLTLSPRDMARFGLLYLDGGRWEGRQIVPEAWVRASTAPHTSEYGYLWWLFEGKAFGAMGDGGNMICCVPERDLVVAAASSFVFGTKNRWDLVKEHILPAILD